MMIWSVRTHGIRRLLLQNLSIWKLYGKCRTIGSRGSRLHLFPCRNRCLRAFSGNCNCRGSLTKDNCLGTRFSFGERKGKCGGKTVSCGCCIYRFYPAGRENCCKPLFTSIQPLPPIVTITFLTPFSNMRFAPSIISSWVFICFPVKMDNSVSFGFM